MTTPPADRPSEGEIINHQEAEELAHLKRKESNLARCYLDLLSRAPAQRPEQGSAYRFTGEAAVDAIMPVFVDTPALGEMKCPEMIALARRVVARLPSAHPQPQATKVLLGGAMNHSFVRGVTIDAVPHHPPYRSECRCACHGDAGYIHLAPCCQPDPAAVQFTVSTDPISPIATVRADGSMQIHPRVAPAAVPQAEADDRAFIDDMRERSKVDDVIVGSEIRTLCAIAERALALAPSAEQAAVVTEAMVDAALVAADKRSAELEEGGMSFKEDAAIVMRAALSAAAEAAKATPT